MSKTSRWSLMSFRGSRNRAKPSPSPLGWKNLLVEVLARRCASRVSGHHEPQTAATLDESSLGTPTPLTAR